MQHPHIQTSRYAFYLHRVGTSLVRKADNASVYFQPGDDTAHAEENAEHCHDGAEMYEGEGDRVFDQWAGQYFSG